MKNTCKLALLAIALGAGGNVARAESVTDEMPSELVQLQSISDSAPSASAFSATDSSDGGYVYGSPFSAEILFFASRFTAPRWGGNSTALALNTQISQTVLDVPPVAIPVPVPAAGLLLLSGLGGIARFTRKRTSGKAGLCR